MQGGTAAASPHFNDRNKEDTGNFWNDDTLCNSLVLLQDHSQPPPKGSALPDVLPQCCRSFGMPALGATGLQLYDDRGAAACAGWMSIAEADFVDASRSPALARALYIPGFSNLHNVFMEYKLLARTSDSSVKHHIKPS